MGIDAYDFRNVQHLSRTHDRSTDNRKALFMDEVFVKINFQTDAIVITMQMHILI